MSFGGAKKPNNTKFDTMSFQLELDKLQITKQRYIRREKIIIANLQYMEKERDKSLDVIKNYMIKVNQLEYNMYNASRYDFSDIFSGRTRQKVDKLITKGERVAEYVEQLRLIFIEAVRNLEEVRREIKLIQNEQNVRFSMMKTIINEENLKRLNKFRVENFQL